MRGQRAKFGWPLFNKGQGASSVFDNRQLAILWKLKMARSQRVHYDENVIQYVPNQGVFLWRKRTGR